MNRSYGDRRRFRYVKAMRRIREDRAQHGSDHRCSCFNLDGATFARFADTPRLCSSWCCGNPRRHWNLPTMQELRAPTVAEETRDIPLHVPLQRPLE